MAWPVIGEADFGIVLCNDCSIGVTALLGYLNLSIPVFCFLDSYLCME